MKKFFTILIGNYGSGKTELALNLAMRFARFEKTALVDLDIVNPYFRSSEKREMLEAQAIRVIAPTFAGKTVDSPAVPAEVASVFVDASTRIVFDVGGDPVGATALGRYRADFAPFLADIEVLYVINTRRPLSSTPDDILEMLGQIQERSRLNITGLINNTNLALETAADDILFGQEITMEVSARGGAPIRYVSGTKKPLGEFAARAPGHMGELLELELFMRPAWLDFKG